MAIATKVCGLRDARSGRAAAEAGARWVGFVFYPPSPRSLPADEARALARDMPPGPAKVGVFVDPSDTYLLDVLDRVPLDYIQLHGSETPARVAAIKAITGRSVIKALKVADPPDLAPVHLYALIADLLLFDAKPPRQPGRLPGGNGLSFDWRLLQRLEVGTPWLLSGGITAENLADAVRLCGASAVDVSTGLESAPGVKDPAKIRSFLALAASLEPGRQQAHEPS